jgi:hypothetical protein
VQWLRSVSSSRLSSRCPPTKARSPSQDRGHCIVPVQATSGSSTPLDRLPRSHEGDEDSRYVYPVFLTKFLAEASPLDGKRSPGSVGDPGVTVPDTPAQLPEALEVSHRHT